MSRHLGAMFGVVCCLLPIVLVHAQYPPPAQQDLSYDSKRLLDFKDKLKDPLGVTSNWSNTDLVCSWNGTICNAAGSRVTGVIIREGGLQGPLNAFIAAINAITVVVLTGNNFLQSEIPADFAALTNLKYFDVSHNNLAGAIPPGFSSVTGLSHFFVNNNNLTGTLPDFRSLKQLAFVNVAVNQLVGPLSSSLGTLPLVNLYANNNHFSEDFSPNLLTGLLGTVTEMDLSNNQLSGSVPTLFQNCTKLLSLGLGGNQLGGIVPYQLGYIPNLETLDLSHNQFRGSIPGTLLSHPKLQFLDVSYNTLTQPLPNSFCAQKTPSPLGIFLGQFNNISGKIPASLAKCASLTHLDLSNNSLTSVIPTGICSAPLIQLLLEGNFLAGSLPDLTKCTALRVLMLSGNFLSGTLPETLGTLPKIQLLDLSHNVILGAIPANILAPPDLYFIDLRNNSLFGTIPSTIGAVGSGANLSDLYLGDNNLQGPIPASLANLPALNIVDLSSNSLTGTFPAELGSGDVILNVLQVSRNNLTGPLPAINTTNLKLLDLSYNQITGTIPFMAQTLVSLLLDHNQFTGELPGQVTTLEKLYYLDLSANSLNGSIPDSTLDVLTGLALLNLSYNHLSGGVPSRLGDLHTLQVLDLSNNALQGSLPNSLTNLTNLYDFNCSNNQLLGPIPQGSNFSRFGISAFAGNLALCGSPYPACAPGTVSTSIGSPPPPPLPSPPPPPPKASSAVRLSAMAAAAGAVVVAAMSLLLEAPLV